MGINDMKMALRMPSSRLAGKDLSKSPLEATVFVAIAQSVIMPMVTLESRHVVAAIRLAATFFPAGGLTLRARDMYHVASHMNYGDVRIASGPCDVLVLPGRNIAAPACRARLPESEPSTCRQSPASISEPRGAARSLHCVSVFFERERQKS